MDSGKSLRKNLLELLDGGHAHASFDNVVADFPAKLRSERPTGLPHSAWMLLEHLRIAQWDILDFSRNPKYVGLKWPGTLARKSGAANCHGMEQECQGIPR